LAFGERPLQIGQQPVHLGDDVEAAEAAALGFADAGADRRDELRAVVEVDLVPRPRQGWLLERVEQIPGAGKFHPVFTSDCRVSHP
jgi:hypothetical protein